MAQKRHQLEVILVVVMVVMVVMVVVVVVMVVGVAVVVVVVVVVLTRFSRQHGRAKGLCRRSRMKAGSPPSAFTIPRMFHPSPR